MLELLNVTSDSGIFEDRGEVRAIANELFVSTGEVMG